MKKLIFLCSFSLLFVGFFISPKLSSAATLPNANHSMWFGYYLDDSFYGNFRSEVSSYVDTYMVWGYFWGTNLTGLDGDFQDAVSSGKKIIFGPNVNPGDTTVTPDALASLDTAKPYWNSISMVYFDELNMDKAGVENFITSFNQEVANRGLAPKPIAINFSEAQFNSNTGYQASNIDYVGLEAYMDPSTQNDTNLVANLDTKIQGFKNLIGNRQMFIVLQAYDRNGAWTNKSSLQSIQTSPYLDAYNDRNVVGMLSFAYGRPGGTRDLGACISTEHKRIWGAINGVTQPVSISCTPTTVNTGGGSTGGTGGTGNAGGSGSSNNGALSISTSTTLPSGKENSPYSTTISATGGTGSYSWSVTSASLLPPGLVLTQSVCVTSPCQVPVTISGTPTNGGTYAFGIRVATSSGEVSEGHFTLVVGSSGGSSIPVSVGAVPQISYLSTKSGSVGTLVTIHGVNFSSTNTVNFGVGKIFNVASSDASGTTLNFQVPDFLTNCENPAQVGIPCPLYYVTVTPDQYKVSVTNNTSTSNTETFTVTDDAGGVPVIVNNNPPLVAPPSVGSGSSSSLITITLQFGMSEPQVKILQQYLNSHGYPLATTGEGSVGFETTYFGTKTEVAVKNFQRAHGLTDDGIVGPLTRSAMN